MRRPVPRYHLWRLAVLSYILRLVSKVTPILLHRIAISSLVSQ
jgi:hypothetical protein